MLEAHRVGILWGISGIGKFQVAIAAASMSWRPFEWTIWAQPRQFLPLRRLPLAPPFAPESPVSLAPARTPDRFRRDEGAPAWPARFGLRRNSR
jgi:hypothetical protein